MNCNARRCTILYEAFQVFKNEESITAVLALLRWPDWITKKADVIQSNAETC